MAIEDVLTRISTIQARFGVNGNVGTSEFEGLLSDAARHGGLSPTDAVDEAAADEVSTASAAAEVTSDSSTDASTRDTADRATTEPSAAGQSTTAQVTAEVITAEQTTSEPPAAPEDAGVVSILGDLGVSTDARSGEALEALSAATAPTLTTAAALGATGSSSLLDLLNGQLGAEEGTAMLASIIAQQQAGAGIVRATGS